MLDIVVESLCSLLPKRISKLGELAYNLWWTWHPEAQALFERIDSVLWEHVYHNPVKFLRQVPRKALSEVIKDSRLLDQYDRIIRDFSQYMLGKEGGAKTWYANYDKAWPVKKGPIAYFSFEYGLHECLPMYSGGLGVLAGDHLKESSDMGLPLVGMGFLYLQGYFRQTITEDGWQEANFDQLDFEQLPITPVHDAAGDPLVLAVELPGRAVYFHLWKAQVGRVPLYLMDTDVLENAPTDRVLTQRLYSPDPDTRINQEMVLGIGGVRALRELKINPAVWHMNEGHPAFSTLERVREFVKAGKTFDKARELVRKNTVFTTHTPVPAGNDKFPIWQIDRHLNNFWNELGLPALTPQPPASIERPVTELLLPAFREGHLALNTQRFTDFRADENAIRRHADPTASWNLGMKMGLTGLASLIPLGIVWLACAAGLARLDRADTLTGDAAGRTRAQRESDSSSGPRATPGSA